MRTFLVMLGSSLAGWIGWWLGAKEGLFTALVVSLIFSGVGLYYSRLWVQEYLGG
jgi:hypothetical protein